MLFNTDLMPNVALPLMNDVHLEELTLANNIYKYLSQSIEHDCKAIEELLKEFIFHVNEHFRNEERMMNETNCPIIHCHEEEHKRVQLLMVQIFKDYAISSDIQLLKDYFEYEFKPWIGNHILTMDTVTGLYLKEHFASIS